MGAVEEFKSESDALLRVKWLLDNSYRVSIWWGNNTQGNRIYYIDSYSMI